MNPDDLSLLLSLVSMLIAAVSIGFGATMLSHRYKSEKATLSPLSELLAQLSSKTTEAQDLSRRVQAQLAAEIDQVKKLESDATTARQIASLNAKDAAAITANWDALLVRHNNKAARANIFQGILFFLGGAAVTVAVTLFVKPVWG